MAVGRDYMLKQPAGPSAPKLFVDTKLVPAAVNMLGSAEVALDRVSVRTGVSARILLGGAATGGALALYWLLARPGTRRVASASAPPEGQD